MPLTREKLAAARLPTLILGQDALHDDWREWLEWASRNRLNDIFFHDTPPSRLARNGATRPDDAEGMAAVGGGWMFERWDTDGPEIVAAAKARGMTVQFGRHHLPALVSRNLFNEHPDWFPLREGIRNRRNNLCVSNRQAMAHLRREARGFFERFAGADVYHLWADDIRGGGWCECDGCARWSPSEQALIATNAVADVLSAGAPGAALSHLAYHDTLARPAGIAPASNLHVLWAPRERCYAHAVADPSCERNRSEYWGRFNDLQSTDDSDPRRLDVLEYYSDAILFKWLAPPLLSVLPADAKAYRDGGAGNLQTLMVGPRPWLGPPWHAWWMAQCAWNPAIDADEALARFCAAAYPEAAGHMVAYYQGSEAAFQPVLERYDLRPMPRNDVLDYADDPRDTLRRKAGELLASAALFRGLFEALPKGGGWLEGEAQQAELQWHVVAHLAHRVAAWDASLGGDARAVERFLPEALGHTEWLESWEAKSNPAAYANLSRDMLRAMRFHASAIG